MNPSHSSPTKALVQLLNSGKYHPIVKPLTFAKLVEYDAGYFYTTIDRNVVLEIGHQFVEDFSTKILNQGVNSSVQGAVWHSVLY